MAFPTFRRKNRVVHLAGAPILSSAVNASSLIKRTQWPFWLALIGFMLNALVPLGQALPRAWIVGNDGTTLPLVLCRTLADLPDSGPAKKSRDLASLNCPICQIFHSADQALSPGAAHVARPILVAKVAFVPIDQGVSRTLEGQAAHPRGPPALA